MLGVSLVALAASLTFQRIRSFDYWWHLRTGGLIAESGAIPRADAYSYTVPGARWIDIHWLHQLGLHALRSLGGHSAVTFGKFGLVVLLLGILARVGYRKERPLVTAAGLTFVLLAACDRFMPRPELPSFVLLAAVLWLFDRYTARPDRWIYAIVPVQLLWVNIHGLFALGIAVCAIHLAAETVRPLLSPGERLRTGRLKDLVLVTLLAVVAALANPNFIEGALYPIQQLGMIGPAEDRGFFGSIIVELYPTLGGEQPASLFVRSLFFLLAALSFAAMAANWRRLAASDPLLWVAFGYLGLGAQRNLALFGIVAALILVRNVNELLDRLPAPRALWRVGSALGACALITLSIDAASGAFFSGSAPTESRGWAPWRSSIPSLQSTGSNGSARRAPSHTTWRTAAT